MIASPPSPRRSTALLLACVLIVSASGCLGALGIGDRESDPRAERVQGQALDAMNDVSTYEASMSMTVEADDGTLHAESVGAVNETSRRMSFDVTVDRPNGRTHEATAYVVNRTMYRKHGDRWLSEDVSDQQIWDEDRLQQQRDLLEGATVFFEGNETVDGDRVYVITSDIDRDRVRAMIENAPDDSASLDGVTIEDFSVTHYVGHDDYQLRKVDVEMTISDGSRTADATMTVTFSRHGEPITIDLPSGIDSS